MMLERLHADVTRGRAHPRCGPRRPRAVRTGRRVTLLGAEGADFHALLRAADLARAATTAGDDVSYVVCRNINFTNVCYVGCSFCGFARHKDDEPTPTTTRWR